MDKTLTGLIGAVGVLVASAPAHATGTLPLTMEAALHATAYADLLTPIPNALALLKASAATPADPAPDGPAASGEPPIETVQYFRHHHHHHHHYRRRYHHHHHHNNRY